MARAAVLAIALVGSACGSLSGPTDTPGGLSSAAIPIDTAWRTDGASTMPTGASTPALAGLRCGDSRGSSPEPQYAFRHIPIPLGSDSCQNIGPLANPKILSLTNDGSLVAFNARDYEHQGNLWFGDLSKGSVGVAYQAHETASNRADILWPQLAAGHLVWLEYVHVGPDVNTTVSQWAVRDMDLATRKVKTVAQGAAPGQGGRELVTKMRFDGQHIAMAESLSNGWRLEIVDLTGHVNFTVPTSEVPFDLALVRGGMLYSTGTDDAVHGTFGKMHLWSWTPDEGSKEIGVDVFQINASGDLASWVTDPVASQGSTGNFQAARLYAATGVFTSGRPISPEDSESGTKGIDGAACGSNAVAWWQQENFHGAWQDVLTLWQPGWSSALQVDTEGNESYHVSLGGGWLVWSEEVGRDSAPLLERIRGVPLAVLNRAS